MPFPKSWILKLPVGLREQPGWVFIGLLVMLAGIGYLTGLSTSTITDVIGDKGLQAWGAFLTATGALVTYATWRAKPSLEKLALRWLVFALMSYTGWLVTVVSPRQSAMTIVLSVILILLAEIRVGYLKLILDMASRHAGGENWRE